MEGKGRLSSRNWDFLDHNRHSEPILKPRLGISVSNDDASRYRAAFVKTSSYSERNALIGEPDTSSIEFSWVPQRVYSSSTKNASEVDYESNIPAPSESTIQNNEHESTKPAKVRNKRVATKELRSKEPKKQSLTPRKKKATSVSSSFKREKKNQDDIFEGEIDFSGVPTPVCSCTGVPHQCYRWGAGGWQSSCCTTSISEHPLPMSLSRPGSRMAGRKMSIGVYEKLLQRLASDGHDLSYAVDLKEHWARHGTNKFVTIR